MTEKLNNVYVENTSLVAGPLESKGPLAIYFDKSYNTYNIDKSFGKSEIKYAKDSLEILLKKTKIKNVDLIIGGDLTNQLCATSFAIKDYKVPHLGVFSACATSMESIIVASKFLENKSAKNVICITSSHNLAEEKQVSDPTEYGYTKPKTATFTSTGGASILLTNKKTNVKVASYTIGTICDMNQKDQNNMGAVMAVAAADTIYKHLNDLNIKSDYYDLILTGDLGIFGKNILKDYMKEEYDIDLNNLEDCGSILYDMKKQKSITAGGSGPVCSALVNYGYIYNQLKEKKLKRVLLVTTGALFSQTTVFQKQNLLSIAHATAWEAIK